MTTDWPILYALGRWVLVWALSNRQSALGRT